MCCQTFGWKAMSLWGTLPFFVAVQRNAVPFRVNCTTERCSVPCKLCMILRNGTAFRYTPLIIFQYFFVKNANNHKSLQTMSNFAFYF
jgi:hypothetical protein